MLTKTIEVSHTLTAIDIPPCQIFKCITTAFPKNFTKILYKSSSLRLIASHHLWNSTPSMFTNIFTNKTLNAEESLRHQHCCFQLQEYPKFPKFCLLHLVLSWVLYPSQLTLFGNTFPIPVASDPTCQDQKSLNRSHPVPSSLQLLSYCSNYQNNDL